MPASLTANPLLPVVLLLGLVDLVVAFLALRELRAVSSAGTAVLDDRSFAGVAPGLDIDGSRGLDGLPGWVRPVLDKSLPERFVDFQVLGEGGMGMVLRARDRHVDRTVAIKVAPPHLSSVPEFRARFLREARALARLEHENIARIYDVPEVPQGEVPVMVMEYLTGEDLAERIKRLGVASLEELGGWLRQAGAGLQFAHDQGVLHRDLKPANIFLEDKGRLKILDFGLASIEDALKLTKTGMRFGTLSFMPPEQARGEPLDPSADQYSLAATAYYLACGKLPYKVEDTLRMNPTPISQYRHGVPEELVAVFTRALSGIPEERYPSVRDFVAAYLFAAG